MKKVVLLVVLMMIVSFWLVDSVDATESSFSLKWDSEVTTIEALFSSPSLLADKVKVSFFNTQLIEKVELGLYWESCNIILNGQDYGLYNLGIGVGRISLYNLPISIKPAYGLFTFVRADDGKGYLEVKNYWGARIGAQEVRGLVKISPEFDFYLHTLQVSGTKYGVKEIKTSVSFRPQGLGVVFSGELQLRKLNYVQEGKLQHRFAKNWQWGFVFERKNFSLGLKFTQKEIAPQVSFNLKFKGLSG